MTDDELLQIIDTPGHLWLIRGGPLGVFTKPYTTLRDALTRAYQISAEGKSPGSIVQMQDDAVEVPVEQIYRLWQSIGLQR